MIDLHDIGYINLLYKKLPKSSSKKLLYMIKTTIVNAEY